MKLSKFLYRIIKEQAAELKRLDKNGADLVDANFRQAQRIEYLERELKTLRDAGVYISSGSRNKLDRIALSWPGANTADVISRLISDRYSEEFPE